METKVHLLKVLVFSFSGILFKSPLTFPVHKICACDGCGRTLIASAFIYLINTPFSASFEFGENGDRVAVDTSPTVIAPNATILCPADASIFLKGHCVFCTIRPYYQRIYLKYDHAHLVTLANVTLKQWQGAHFPLTSAPDSPLFTCPVDEQASSELLEIQRGINFLRGNMLRIVTIERHPFTKQVDNEFTGVVFELLRSLQKKYNFTSHVFYPYDGNWGNMQNGIWNGMVGQVLRNEADLGAAPFSVTLERAKVIDFSMPFHQEPTAILIPAPTPGNKLAILIRPLSFEVWLAVFTTVCVLVPSLFVMHILSLRLRRKANDCHVITAATSNKRVLYKPINMTRLIVDLIQFIIGSLVQEGIISPVNKTSRFLIVLWWFLTLVLANIYVGYMVSFLSVPKLYDVVDGLEGLLQQTALRWTYRRSTALQDLFQSNTSGVYKAIGLGVKEADLATTDGDGVMKVLRGNFAFIKERSFLDVAVGSDFEAQKQCRLTIAEKTFFTVGFAFIVQKGCTFLELLDKEILHSMTTGLMDYWKRLHWPRHLWCVNAARYIVSTQPKARKLTLDDCQGAYFLLLVGLTLASISFLAEIRPWKLFQKLGHFGTTTADPFRVSSGEPDMNGYQIIVIPVKEDIYHKIHKLNLFKALRKGVIDKARGCR